MEIKYDTKKLGELTIQPYYNYLGHLEAVVRDQSGKEITSGTPGKMQPETIAMAARKGIDLGDRTYALGQIAIPQAVADDIKAMLAAYKIEIEQAASAILPIGYIFERGCDCADKHYLIFDPATPEAIKDRADRSAEKLIKKHLKYDEIQQIAERTHAEVIPANMATYGGWKFGAEAVAMLTQIANQREAEATNRREEYHAQLLAIDVPERAIASYDQYRGDADLAWESDDEIAWAAIRHYGDAIEAQKAKADQ